MVFLIAIDYSPDQELNDNTPYVTREQIIDRIKEIGRWTSLTKDIWFVDADKVRSSDAIFNKHFLPIVNSQFQLFICALSNFGGHIKEIPLKWLENHLIVKDKRT